MSNNADTPKPITPDDAYLETYAAEWYAEHPPTPEPWDDRDHDTRDEITNDYYYGEF